MKHKIEYRSFEGFERANALLQEHSEMIREYVDQLLWWNERVNLISRDVSRETIVEHVRHSLVIEGSRLFEKSKQVVDTGTGGGLPGIPLAIACESKEIILNDIVSKKVMSCKQIIQKLSLKNCVTAGGSIASFDTYETTCIVSKHAFKINDLINMVGEKPWLGVILLKGQEEIESEIKDIEQGLQVDIYSLEHDEIPFYDGKALVEITRL